MYRLKINYPSISNIVLLVQTNFRESSRLFSIIICFQYKQILYFESHFVELSAKSSSSLTPEGLLPRAVSLRDTCHSFQMVLSAWTQRQRR